MKMFFDTRGRLFGKINIIDLLIILAIIVAILIFILIIFRIDQNQWVTVYYRLDNIDLNLVNSIKEGFVEKRGGKIVAEVLEIDVKNVNSIKQIADVILKVKLLTNLDKNTLFHGSRDVKIGTKRALTLGPVELKYGYIYISGIIIKIEDDPLTFKSENKTITLFIRREDVWLKDNLHVSDNLIGKNKEIVGKIVSINSELHEFVHVGDETGKIFVLYNPLYYDLTLSIILSVEVFEDTNSLLFGNQDLMINGNLYLKTINHVSFSGEILAIK